MKNKKTKRELSINSTADRVSAILLQFFGIIVVVEGKILLTLVRDFPTNQDGCLAGVDLQPLTEIKTELILSIRIEQLGYT